MTSVFGQAKTDQFGPLNTISSHFQPLKTILNGQSFKNGRPLEHFKILAKDQPVIVIVLCLKILNCLKLIKMNESQ